MSTVPDPIFVRGMSRSGGTLMCTLLDAHPDIAMSYELYPGLLELDEDTDLKALAKQIAKPGLLKNADSVMPNERFATFVRRCTRSGITPSDFAALLRQFAEEGGKLSTVEGRLRLVELCALRKMEMLGKKRWGMKCNNAYDDYLASWPAACFLNMLRDGRDVLASQLNTGNFQNTPREVAEGWIKTHRRFKSLAERGDVKAKVVRYENLTHDAEPELREICEFLGVPFSDRMLRHHELDLTIYKTNHLSKDRITREIDTSKIGRWKRDLTSDQLSEFMAVAGEDISRNGYQ